MAEEGGATEAEDSTEAATPRRLEKAREDGDVALSREVAGFGALAGGVLGLMIGLPSLGMEMLRGLRALMARAHEVEALYSEVQTNA